MHTIKANGRIYHRLTTAEVKAILPFTSTDETRLQLNAVCFDAALGVAVATDGHTLARLVGTGYVRFAGECLVAREDMASAVKSAGPGGIVEVSYPETGERKAASIACCTKRSLRSMSPDAAEPIDPFLVAATLAVKPVDVQFPPYLQVIPERGFKAGGPIGVNGGYMARLDAIGALCNGRTGGVELTGCQGGLDPIRFDASGAETGEWTVVIMPMRAGSNGHDSDTGERADTLCADRARESRDVPIAAE